MRSVNLNDISHLSPKLTWAEMKVEAKAEAEPVKTPDSTKADAVADAVADAIRDFPGHLAKAMASIPAPVMAPRPAGTWIVDVRRDGAGQMSQMEAKFHETK
jgi:hypothetical protein